MKSPQRSGRKASRRAVFLWFCVLFYMGIIYVFSSMSGELLPTLSGGLDKVFHACMYALLAFLLYHAFRESGVVTNLVFISLLLSCLYAATDELHQYFVPGRDASLGDLIADFLGALAGGGFASYVKR